MRKPGTTRWSGIAGAHFLSTSFKKRLLANIFRLVLIRQRRETLATFALNCKSARDRLSSKYLGLDPPSSCNQHESGTHNFLSVARRSRGTTIRSISSPCLLPLLPHPFPPLPPCHLSLAENAISETPGTNFQQIAPARFSRRFNTREYRVYIPEFSRGRRP